MPLTIPIVGAGDAPTIETIYPAYESVGVISSTLGVGYESIDGLTHKLETWNPESISLRSDFVEYDSESLSIADVQRYESSEAISILSGPSFVILADLLAAVLAGVVSTDGTYLQNEAASSSALIGAGYGAGSFAFAQINAELRVNGTVLPIKNFSYQVPTGKLGSILNVTLAEPLLSSVPNGALITFKLLVQINGVNATYTLVDNGRMEERGYTIAFRGGDNGGPADAITISSIDVLADKFTLAPRQPVTLYDPRRVRFDEVNTKREQAIRDANGRILVRSLEPVAGLTAYTVLQRAYASAFGVFAFTQRGVGLAGVITNIPNYAVRRADFEVDSTWHDGAQPCVAMFAPLYFVSNNILYIIDVDQPLPYGTTPHTLTLADHKSLTQRLEYKPASNAVLLTYQFNGNDPTEGLLSAEVTSEEVDERGSVGSADYSKVTTRRRDKVYFAIGGSSDSPLDRFPLSVDVETVQQVTQYNNDGTVADSFPHVVHKETTDYHYEGDLLTSQERVTKAFLYNALYNGLFQIETEATDIDWTEDPINPGVKLQSAVRTDISTLCVYGDEQETVSDGSTPGDGAISNLSFSRPVPILLAQSSGIITDAWETLGMVHTKSIRERLVLQKGNQYQVEVIETDQINNTVKKSYSQPVTGTTTHDPFETKSRTLLISDGASELAIGPRVPVEVNVYELPYSLALPFAYRVLQRLLHPLGTLPVSLPGVDFVIARGSVIRGQTRTGYTTNHVVTGYTITGENLGREGHRISQTLDATELLS